MQIEKVSPLESSQVPTPRRSQRKLEKALRTPGSLYQKPLADGPFSAPERTRLPPTTWNTGRS